MRIKHITENKENYLDILLLTGDSEDKVNKQLKEGELFILIEDGIIKTACIVGILKHRNSEIKTIVTVPGERRKGYGRNMIYYICEHYSRSFDNMFVGFLSSDAYRAFFRKCGFEYAWSGTEIIYYKRTLDAEIDVKKVVDMAVEAGRILLKNGGEIFRVEETMERICHRFHVEQIDTFVMSHAIFISAKKDMEDSYTVVKQVPLSSSHLGIVAEVNALSREITAGNVTVDEAVERLREIDKTPSASSKIKIFASGLGSGCFGYMVGATITESVLAFFIGCILFVWVLWAKKHNISSIISNIIGGVIITGLAILAQQALSMLGLHLEGMISGAIMPLIPGVAFVNAIRDIADSDFLSGTVRMIDALLVFVYIAIGVGVTLGVWSSLSGGGLLL